MKNMKMTGSFLAMSLAILLAGCGPADSLHPLFNDHDVVFDSALVGEWVGDGGESFKFEKAANNAYRLTYTEENGNEGDSEQTLYTAHLVYLRGYRFLDIEPEKFNASPGSYSLHSDWCHSGFEPLFRVGDGSYVRLVVRDPDTGGMRFNLHLLRAHQFFRVWSDGATMRFAQLDGEWLTKAVAQGRVAVAHTFVGMEKRDVVLTAPTSDLQQFVLEHSEDKEAFSEITTLRHRN
jgi:hypothetical protein